MHYAYSRKVDNNNTVCRANIEDRQQAIKQLGVKEFYSNKSYEYLWDKPVPCCFVFIFNVFLEIYNSCTLVGGLTYARNITWQDIESYCRLRKIDLSQLEIDYLLKIKGWADQQIAELEKDK